jgi:hypothetical protein
MGRSAPPDNLRNRGGIDDDRGSGTGGVITRMSGGWPTDLRLHPHLSQSCSPDQQISRYSQVIRRSRPRTFVPNPAAFGQERPIFAPTARFHHR